MPRLEPAHTHISLPVSDRAIGSGHVQQVATFRKLTTRQDERGICSAIILVLVTLHDPATGARLRGAGLDAYPVELVADNDCLVAADTGQIMALRRARQSESEWLAYCDTVDGDTMLQGDFFEQVRENQAVLIGQMIRQHIAQADAMGRFA